MIASYMVDFNHNNINERKQSIELRLSRIALSPMAKCNATQNGNARDERLEKDVDTDSNNEGDAYEADTFDAGTHLQFFRDNLEFIGCEFDE